MNAPSNKEAEEVLLRSCVMQDWTGVYYALAHGASVNCRDRQGRTPLHLAVMSCADDIERFLLGRGASVNAQDSDGDTPLHCAARWQWPALLLPLLAHPDVQTDIRNSAGNLPAGVAGEHPRTLDNPIEAEMRETLDEPTTPPELRFGFALRRWVDSLSESAVPLFRSRAKRTKIAELRDSGRFGSPSQTSDILSAPSLRGRLAHGENQLSPLLEEVSTAASYPDCKCYVSLDVDPTTDPGKETTWCIRIQSPHSLELAGLLADSLACSGAKKVRVHPLDHFYVDYATLGSSTTVSFAAEDLDAAALGRLLSPHLSCTANDSYRLLDELDEAADMHCYVEASLAFPAADGTGAVVVTQHPRAVAAATRRRQEFTLSEPTFGVDWSAVEDSSNFRHRPVAVKGEHLEQLFSSVRQDELRK